MTIEDCFQLGYIVKAHGINEEVQALFDSDFPQDYAKLGSAFFQQDGVLVPFFIESISLNGNRALMAIEDVRDRNSAEELVGTGIYLPLSSLPELKGNQFYFHEVVGFIMINEGQEIGAIDKIYDLPNQDLFGVSYQNREVLVPINDQIVKKVDREGKAIHVALPQGLIELYTS